MKIQRTLIIAVGMILVFSTTLIAQITALKTKGVLDPAEGKLYKDYWVLVKGDEIIDINKDPDIPQNTKVIDLSDHIVMPGLMDTHTHLAWHINDRKNDGYVLSIVREPTAYRAIQGVQNARDMLLSGFTTVRDVGNAANYADTALRMAIEDSLVIGPTIYNAGRIISPFGGQRFVIPERQGFTQPEYYFADTRAEIKKAIRKNIHFGAKLIKLVVDDQKYIYSAEDIKFAVEEAARAGLKVAAHCATNRGVRNAIKAGVASIEHGFGITRETMKLLAQKQIPFVSTTFSLPVLKAMASDLSNTPEEDYRSGIETLKMAYEEGVFVAFGSDVITMVPGMNRGEAALSYIEPFQKAGATPKQILQAFTINNSKTIGLQGVRGLLKKGWKADIIAVPDNPLDDIENIKKVQWVMKNGKIVKDQIK